MWNKTKGDKEYMSEVLMFITGFTAITSIYEIAKSSKSSRSQKALKIAEKVARKR